MKAFENVRGIFERGYFANNGPLVQELDSTFASFVGADFSVALTDDFVAAMLLGRAVFSAGDEVIVPTTISRLVVEALKWGDIVPILVDVDPDRFNMLDDDIRGAVTSRTRGLMAVHQFGALSEAERLQELGRNLGLRVIFDGRDAVGCTLNGHRAGEFGDATLFSFNHRYSIGVSQGASVATSDEHIAKMLRTMRNFHPAQTFAQAPLRMNGKMAELPPALILSKIADFGDVIASNSERYAGYRESLGEASGITLFDDRNDESNRFRCLIEVRNDFDATALRRHLLVEGVELRAAFADTAELTAPPAPLWRNVASRWYEVPNDVQVTRSEAHRIALLITKWQASK